MAGWRNLLRGSTDNTLVQLFRYTFVGGVAFVFDFGFLYILTEFAGLHYLLSASLSFLLGLTVNYVLSVLWVFSRHALKSRWVEFGIFATVGLVGLALNALFMWLFTDVAGLYYLLSKVGSTLLVFLWNFFARKVSLFR
jgi:putative flippase GtrA